MRSIRIIVAIAAAAALSVLPPAGARAQETPVPAAVDPAVNDALVSVPADYRLDIGDTVRVDVLRHANDGVNANVLIPADGMVRLPRLKAAIASA